MILRQTVLKQLCDFKEIFVQLIGSIRSFAAIKVGLNTNICNDYRIENLKVSNHSNTIRRLVMSIVPIRILIKILFFIT